MAKHRIMATMLTLGFWCQRSWWNFNRGWWMQLVWL